MNLPYHSSVQDWSESLEAKRSYHKDIKKESSIISKRYQQKSKKYSLKSKQNFTYKENTTNTSKKQVIHFCFWYIKKNMQACFYCGKKYVVNSKKFPEHEQECSNKPLSMSVLHLLPQPKVYVGVILPIEGISTFFTFYFYFQ